MRLIQDFKQIIEHVRTVLLPSYHIVSLLNDLHKNGAKTYLVGGAVRDLFLGQSITDVDIEVHRVSLSALEKILRRYGPLRTRGKSFAVLSVDGIAVDWSLPRSDGLGRHPDVIIDPFMDITKACSRRDLTINAMALDLSSFQLEDPFGGLSDLKHGILRAPVVEHFTDDPLRFYRVMQFISRFDMKPDEKLTDLCVKMDISAVSSERIVLEFEKLFLKSKKPSLGIAWLLSIDRLKDIVPELHESILNKEALFRQALDGVDAIAVSDFSEVGKIVFMLAALLYPLKNKTMIEQKAALGRISNRKSFFHVITQLIEHADIPVLYAQDNYDMVAYKKLAYKLSLWNGSCRDLIRFSHAVYLKDTLKKEAVLLFEKNAQEYKVLDEPIAPLLTGSDAIYSVDDHRSIGTLLKQAYDFQITHNITSKEELLKKFFN